MMDDGVSLTSRAHPRAKWWVRLYDFLFRPTISLSALESVDIKVKEPDVILSPQQARILNVVLNRRYMKHESKARIVNLADIESKVVWEYYVTGDRAVKETTPVLGEGYYRSLDALEELSRITICFLIMQNGFVLVGTSECVSIRNFDEAVGRKYAREDALSKMWPVEGYLLKEKLHREAS